VNFNKPLEGPLPAMPAGFQVTVNGNRVTLSTMALDADNPRIITFGINTTLRSTDQILISYTGTQIDATDGTSLNTFTQQVVENRVAIIHPVPGKVEAEDYFFESGLELENTTDIGGGQNISYLDNGDFADYYIDVEEDGSYWVDYRTAALSESGAVKLEIIAPGGTAEFLHQLSFPSTGGWQNWTTTRNQVFLTAGQHQLRMTITAPLFNINWMEFSWRSTGIEDAPSLPGGISLYPNPTGGVLFVEGALEAGKKGEILVFDLRGRPLLSKPLSGTGPFTEPLELEGLATGTCVVLVREQGGRVLARELVVIGD
jgi:endoglucanase